MSYGSVIDVSNNRPIDHADLKASGAIGLIAKATEGATFKDATYPEHRKIAKAEGKPFGGFVFLHAASAGNEAEFFINYAKPRRGDIQPVVDAEGGGLDGKPTADLAKRALSCLERLEAKGYRPLLYTSAATWKQLVSYEPRLRHYRAWEADYPGRFTRWVPGLAKLRIRLGRGASVVLWQWTSVYGVNGKSYDASRLMVPLDRLLI